MSKPLQSVAGQKVFIDPVVLEQVDSTKPSAMSRTSWVNYLVQLGLKAAEQQRQQLQQCDA